MSDDEQDIIEMHEEVQNLDNDLDGFLQDDENQEGIAGEGALVADTEETEENDNADENDDQEKTTVKPKRVVKNPLPKLNDNLLKGPRGIATLEKHFERVKFKGKGHEEKDLNVIMKMYEYWCHRLFPKYPFDTCIQRLETLGKKKSIQTHIKRIRYDLLLEDQPIIESDAEENAINESTNSNTPFDNLTNTLPPLEEPQLTEEQLERIRLNKERAERKRQEKLRQIEENRTFAEQSLLLPSTSQSGIELSSTFAEETENTQYNMSEFTSETDEQNQLPNTLSQTEQGSSQENEMLVDDTENIACEQEKSNEKDLSQSETELTNSQENGMLVDSTENISSEQEGSTSIIKTNVEISESTSKSDN